MDDKMKERLRSAGIELDQTIRRFAGNEAMVERYLFRFPEDPTMSDLCSAMAEGDRGSATNAAHTLKGLTGNLGVTRLYAVSALLTSALRAGDDAASVEQFVILQKEYADFVGALTEIRDTQT